MATTVELQVGLNITIGGVPVALQADIDTATNTYTFDGSMQSAVIHLGEFLSYVGTQFGVSVQLPPELNLDAKIDYIAGQVIYKKPQTGNPTTQLGASAKFELSIGGDTFVLQFYVAANLGGVQTGADYVVGAAIDTNLEFKKLPLVGDIPGLNDLALTKLGFSYTNATPAQGAPAAQFQIPEVTASPNPLFTRNDPNAREAQVYSITSTAVPQNFSLTSGGFSFTAGLTNVATGATQSNFSLPMALPAASAPSPLPVPAPYYPEKTSPPASPVHWIDINKTFGPVNLQKIGLNYSSGEATFGISAGLALGGFALDLEGLCITFPMPLPGMPAGKSVSFDLSGLAMNFSSGPFTIGGAFLKTTVDSTTSYYGEVLVQFSSFGFRALGGYTPAQQDKPASFFIYANLSIPLGGPPFLFITGFAGGFGINNSLILPTLAQLPTYILLPANAPKEAGTAVDTIKTVLPQLQSVFVNQPGEYWVAAGIQFTSFEMIQSFVVVTVAFGVDFQIAVIGSCAMTLPTGGMTPIAYVEIDILASYSASTGLLAVEGELSPASNLFGGFCKLQGGFAFYIWTSGAMAGQYVVTLGGYNSAFPVPEGYPVVPRLGLSFGLGPFQCSGQSYFALTPAMLMAGMSITATWSLGPIKAWISAGIDFLIAWAPFLYQAEVYVTVGCSINLGLFTLNLHIGADLQIWGPDFGGKAVVDLDIVSFTIAFGSAAPTAPPIGWSQFATNFLPAATPAASSAKRLMASSSAEASPQPAVCNIIKASVASGLIGTIPNGNSEVWLINPDSFAILTNSTVPANNGEWSLAAGGVFPISDTVASYNSPTVNVSNGPYLALPAGASTYSATDVWNPVLNIAPMSLSGVQSFHTISLFMHADTDPQGVYSLAVTAVSVVPQLSNASAALWAPNQANKSVDDPAMVPNALVGFSIAPIPRVPAATSAVPLLELLFAFGNSTSYGFTSAEVNGAFSVSSSESSNAQTLTIQVSGAATEQLVNNNYILSSLADPWVSSQRESILNDLNANGFGTYSAQQIDVSVLASQTALTDWPIADLLGEV